MLLSKLDKNDLNSLFVNDKGAKLSYAQFGEDLILWSILETHNRLLSGFYIDVGAHDPIYCSNTALLHKFKNWTGINIDASEDSIDTFNLIRPKDINICCPINHKEELLDYAIFNHPGINTLDPSAREAQRNAPHGHFKLLKTIQLRTQTLEKILDDHLPLGQNIDVLNVDVEGLDLKVLLSNNWSKYKPFVIMVEIHGLNLQNSLSNPIVDFLTQKGYKLVSHCFVTAFFIKI